MCVITPTHCAIQTKNDTTCQAGSTDEMVCVVGFLRKFSFAHFHLCIAIYIVGHRYSAKTSMHIVVAATIVAHCEKIFLSSVIAY